MRVENQNVNNIAGSGSFSAIQSTGAGSRSPSGSTDSSSIDQVSLSGASSLINLAKNVGYSDRQSRIDDLTAQFRSGQYTTSATDVSRSLIQHSQSGQAG